MAYAKERYQFGVLIGSFQGIQHGFATSITNIEGSHFLSSRAIAALEEGADNSEQLAGMAFLFASEAALNAAATSLQYHGGYGFAEEYDIERKFRETRLYRIAPVSTNLILSFLAEHVLGLPRSF